MNRWKRALEDGSLSSAASRRAERPPRDAGTPAVDLSGPRCLLCGELLGLERPCFPMHRSGPCRIRELRRRVDERRAIRRRERDSVLVFLAAVEARGGRGEAARMEEYARRRRLSWPPLPEDRRRILDWMRGNPFDGSGGDDGW